MLFISFVFLDKLTKCNKQRDSQYNKSKEQNQDAFIKIHILHKKHIVFYFSEKISNNHALRVAEIEGGIGVVVFEGADNGAEVCTLFVQEVHVIAFPEYGNVLSDSRVLTIKVLVTSVGSFTIPTLVI